MLNCYLAVHCPKPTPSHILALFQRGSITAPGGSIRLIISLPNPLTDGWKFCIVYCAAATLMVMFDQVNPSVAERLRFRILWVRGQSARFPANNLRQATPTSSLFTKPYRYNISTNCPTIGVFRGLGHAPFGKKISFCHRKKFRKHGLTPLCKHLWPEKICPPLWNPKYATVSNIVINYDWLGVRQICGFKSCNIPRCRQILSWHPVNTWKRNSQ